MPPRNVCFPNHCIDSAVAAIWHIECYDAFTANRRENGLVGPDRP